MNINNRESCTRAGWDVVVRSHVTNRRRVSDNNNMSQLLGDSFSVSQQPPSWDPCSHYSMELILTWDWKPRCPVAAIHHRVIPHPEEAGAVPPTCSEPIFGWWFFNSISVHSDSHGWSIAGNGIGPYIWDGVATELFTIRSMGHLHPVKITAGRPFNKKTFKDQLYVSTIWNFQLPFLHQDCEKYVFNWSDECLPHHSYLDTLRDSSETE